MLKLIKVFQSILAFKLREQSLNKEVYLPFEVPKFAKEKFKIKNKNC